MLAISGSLKPICLGQPVLIYGPCRFGPRYGIVVGGAGQRPIPQLDNEAIKCADIAVFLDNATDHEMRAKFEDKWHRNTVASVPIFDPLRDDERTELLSAFYHGWFAEQYTPEAARVPG